MREKNPQDYSPLLGNYGLNKVLELLSTLNNSETGRVMYQQIEQVVRDSQHVQNNIIRGYAAIAQVLISAYRKSLPTSTLLSTELELVQKRLKPPVTISDLAIIHAYLRKATKLIKEVTALDNNAFNDVLSPFLSGVNIPGDSDIEQRDLASESEQNNSNIQQVYEENSGTFRYIEQSIDSIYRSRLNQHHKEIMKVQANLVDKVGAVMRKQTGFTQRLESAMEQMEKMRKDKKPEQLRINLMNEIETILTEQSGMVEVMHDTQTFLHLIGSNIRKLSDELDQVRVLSLTDDLTQLPNRRAFLRRIKDEMARSRRDNTILTIAMIDLDAFKEINDKFGHAVGDEMLRIYSRDVLSIFRRYDMVARYGGEEFAVILPNTDKQGSEYAFRKIQKKVSETVTVHGNQTLRIPTFSAGLAIYSPGESVDSLLERVDNALYKAKQAGRNRVEYDLAYLAEEETDEKIN